MRRSVVRISLGVFVLTILSSLNAWSQPITHRWTSSADFNLGTSTNINSSDVPDQLQLNLSTIETPYLWVANTSSNTVSQIDASTGQVIRVVDVGPSPSRVAVDLDHNCWVGMRGNESGPNARAVKVDAVSGAVTPGPWAGSVVRGVAINRMGQIWISSSQSIDGGYLWILVDPVTLSVLETINSDIGSYGIVINMFDKMFSSTSWLGGDALERRNATTGEREQRWNLAALSGNVYGMAVGKNGKLWGALWVDHYVAVFDQDYQCPNGAVTCQIDLGNGIIDLIDVGAMLPSGGLTAGGRGISADRDGNIWAVLNDQLGSWTTAPSYVVKIDGETHTPLFSVEVGTAAVGVAYTADGSIWVVNYGGGGPNPINHACPGGTGGNGTVTQMTLDGTIIGTYPTCGNNPYTYSEMAGYQLLFQTLSNGRWTAIWDSGVTDLNWDTIEWDDVLSPQTMLEVRIRSAATEAQLESSPWIAVVNGDDISWNQGRFIEVEVYFHTSIDDQSPILEELRISSVCYPNPPDDNCDNLDNDCDGSTDEDYQPQQTFCGIGACAATGATSCIDGVEQDSCTSGTAAADDATCDGIDDDCDDATDEDYLALQTSCGIGPCASTGVTSCIDGFEQDSCTSGTAAADDTTCDGIDDDCDDATDEDYEALLTSCGIGACAATGVTSCITGTEQDSCSPGIAAADDATCDGIDDDCDDATDEDYQPLETSCGIGPCASTGVTSCIDGVEQDSCTSGTAAADDATCDGIDDDCDDVTDEDYQPLQTTCGIGACASTGVTSCIDGVEQDSCTSGTAAADDATCDGIDDDCDDVTDEDYEALPTSCGIGACASTGVTSCINGTVQDSCSPGTAAADDATCDGIDEDCDGNTDEDSECPAGGICQEGQCIGGDQVTSGCGCSSTTHKGSWTYLLLFGLLIWVRRGAARSKGRSRL